MYVKVIASQRWDVFLRHTVQWLVAGQVVVMKIHGYTSVRFAGSVFREK